MQAAETLFPAQPFLDFVYLEIREQIENFMKMHNSSLHGPDRNDDDGTDAGIL